MVYDCLPVLAVLILATFPFLPFLNGKVLIPREVGALAYLYWLVQGLLIWAFFIYFWTTRGQTVGMLAWRLRLQRLDGTLADWRKSVARLVILSMLLVPFIAGYALIWHDWPHRARSWAVAASLLPVALAYLWQWVDRDGLAWHDRWTGTRVVVLPKRS